MHGESRIWTSGGSQPIVCGKRCWKRNSASRLFSRPGCLSFLFRGGSLHTTTTCRLMFLRRFGHNACSFGKGSPRFEIGFSYNHKRNEITFAVKLLNADIFEGDILVRRFFLCTLIRCICVDQTSVYRLTVSCTSLCWCTHSSPCPLRSWKRLDDLVRRYKSPRSLQSTRTSVLASPSL